MTRELLTKYNELKTLLSDYSYYSLNLALLSLAKANPEPKLHINTKISFDCFIA